jgi:hypothetical protein
MLRLRALSFVSLTAICLTPLVSLADDFAPPPWSRLHPGAVTAEWEFLTPANPASPDGPLTDLSHGGGTVPGGTRAEIFGPGIGWGTTSDGNWFFPGGGTDPKGMRFWVDNVPDLEPVKHLRVQVTSSFDLPGTAMFIDTLAGFNFAATGSTPGPVSMFTAPGTSPFGPVWHTLFTWDMFPNPDWETFVLHVTGGGEIRQVVIDTISTSIPEPATFVVYGVAVLLVGLVYWKRPAGWTL